MKESPLKLCHTSSRSEIIGVKNIHPVPEQLLLQPRLLVGARVTSMQKWTSEVNTGAFTE